MDTIINNYFKLGPQFDGELKTRHLHDNEDFFWISPNGELFEFYTLDTFRYEGEPTAKLPTGKNIKLKPKVFSDDIVVYPANRYGSSEGWVEARLHIVDGKVQDHIIYKKGARLCRE